MESVEKVYKFLQKAGYYFLLTVDDDGYPKGRAFTSKMIVNGTLYLATGKAKRVFRQIEANPHVELMAYQMRNRQYLRADATAVVDEDPALVKAYLEKEPQVRGDFTGDAEPQIGMFHLIHGKAEIFTLEGSVKGSFTF